MNNKQSKQSNSQLQTSGKESSLDQRSQVQKARAEMSLITISKTGLFKYTPEECWDQGTNIKTARRVMPEETRAAVISMIKTTVDSIDAKKTLSSFEDIALCAEMIFEIFPVLKLEELKLICQRMITGHYGKYYERLKIAEFRECITKHEEESAPILER